MLSQAAGVQPLMQNTNEASPRPTTMLRRRTKEEEKLAHLHQLFPLKMSIFGLLNGYRQGRGAIGGFSLVPVMPSGIRGCGYV